MAQWYFDDDADLSLLDGLTIGILGYGNQGRSQALNMRDNGLNVIVGNRPDCSFDRAKEDGFPAYDWAEAASRADILFLLVPDEVMPALYDEHVEPGLEEGNALVFASGYNIYFEHIQPPETVDVLMLAPRMIGQGVRDHFVSGESFPSMIAVEQDATGKAMPRVLALAKGIGSTKMGVVMSSFEEETVVDLFTEHLGPLYAIRRHFEALVEAGYSPEVLVMELYGSGEMIAISQAYRDLGLWAQLPLHSRTSQFGQEVWSKMMEEDASGEEERLRRIIENIRNGEFDRRWTAEQQAGYPEFEQQRQKNLNHPMVQAEQKLYRLLGRIEDAGGDTG